MPLSTFPTFRIFRNFLVFSIFVLFKASLTLKFSDHEEKQKMRLAPAGKASNQRDAVRSEGWSPPPGTGRRAGSGQGDGTVPHLHRHLSRQDQMRHGPLSRRGQSLPPPYPIFRGRIYIIYAIAFCIHFYIVFYIVILIWFCIGFYIQRNIQLYIYKCIFKYIENNIKKNIFKSIEKNIK